MQDRKCIAQLAYEEFNRGQISQKEMETMVGLDIAETLQDHPARPYPTPGQQLLNYIEGRTRGLMQRDGSMAVKNGEWVQLIVRLRSLNTVDADLLIWAKESCVRANALGKVEKIQTQLDRHLSNRLPIQLFANAVDVQRLDSDEKSRGGRE